MEWRQKDHMQHHMPWTWRKGNLFFSGIFFNKLPINIFVQESLAVVIVILIIIHKLQGFKFKGLPHPHILIC